MRAESERSDEDHTAERGKAGQDHGWQTNSFRSKRRPASQQDVTHGPSCSPRVFTFKVHTRSQTEPRVRAFLSQVSY